MFVSGYWADGATQITPGTDSFSKGFLASNVLSKEAMPVGTTITVMAGYQIRISAVSFSSETGFKVVKRSENFQGEVELTEAMYDGNAFMVINIQAVPAKDLTDEAATAQDDILTIVKNIE